MIPFDDIDARLEKLGKDRAWLAEKTPYSAAYIRDLMAPKSTRRTERVQLIISDAIEKEESAQVAADRLPDQLALAPTADEFNAWCRAYKASPAETLKEWAIDELNKAAAQWAQTKKNPFHALADPAPNIIELPFFGTVAAGLPAGPTDVADDTARVVGDYDPATHYTLRVHGRSMEPDYPDGALIICRKLRDGEYPSKGQDVIASDASGAYFKRLAYLKEGPKGSSPRKATPRLVSINPEFPEVIPVSDCPITALVVGRA